ncbi:MAG TPA: BamA/TamA family outer membrane protein [Gemmatimonadales bacterium]|nr:BamA/TamA family outer membrane protein [Gemmatimonadales bacterium]
MSHRVTRPTLLGAAGLIWCLAAAPDARAQVDSSQARDTTGRDTTRVPPGAPAARAPVAEEAEQPGPEPRARWRTSWFPYLAGGANDSPVLAFRVRHWQPADYEARTTYTAALNGDAGIAPRGSRYLAVSFKAPGLWDGWRISSLGILQREARYGYYGLGNDTRFDPDSVGKDDPFLYRMRRTRYRGAVEVTRRVKGPLQVAFLGDYEHARFTSLPGPSKFVDDFPSGELKEDDISGRVALIYDTRDNEFNTHQGVLLEAGTQVGSGNNGYTRQYAILRGYLTVREGTVLAARIAGSGMGGRPSLDARFVLPGWEREIPVLGGEYSHRGLDYGRLTGRGTLFGNFEVRHDLLALGDLGAITLLGFLDAGRVFENEDFRLTTKDMKVGGGGGIALRILRANIFVFNYARGPDGGNFSVGSGWMF